MSKKSLAIAIFAATGLSVALAPYASNYAGQIAAAKLPVVLPPFEPSTTQIAEHGSASIEQAATIELVFALDTTSSMGGMIAAAKDKIWSIASTAASTHQNAQVRIGLVAFRDRGDAYVTQVIDLSTDLDSMYARLMAFQAQGGGDTPESVNQALHEAVHKISWSRNDNAYRAIFLVGDAPPQMNYNNDVPYNISVADAKDRGIVVNTIQCGNMSTTRAPWQQIASLGAGEYFRVEQSGSALAMVSPFDAKLAKLGSELDSTRLYYGSKEEKARHASKISATKALTESASTAALARRSTYNVSKGGASNQFGDGDLISDLETKDVELSSLSEEALPAPMAEMDPTQRQQFVEHTKAKRNALTREIQELSKKRDAYLRKEAESREDTRSSLDNQLFDVLSSQLRSRGLELERSTPAY